MSMVYDHFDQQFPKYNEWPFQPYPPTITPSTGGTISSPEVVKQAIQDFNAAKEAAAKLDELMKQKDCVDAEKAKLQERVDRLEKIIDALLAEKAKA